MCLVSAKPALSKSYNLGQNKMEQQTPIPPKSTMKPREGQQRAILPILGLGGWGGGGLGFPFILSTGSLPADVQTNPKGRLREGYPTGSLNYVTRKGCKVIYLPQVTRDPGA